MGEVHISQSMSVVLAQVGIVPCLLSKGSQFGQSVHGPSLSTLRSMRAPVPSGDEVPVLLLLCFLWIHLCTEALGSPAEGHLRTEAGGSKGLVRSDSGPMNCKEGGSQLLAPEYHVPPGPHRNICLTFYLLIILAGSIRGGGLRNPPGLSSSQNS